MSKKDIKKLPFEWKAYEYEHYGKSSQWFLSVVVISLAIFAAAIILDNFLFGILAVLSGITIALYGIKKPRVIDFALTSRGAQVGEKLFFYSDLDSFWLHYDPPYAKLISIKSKKNLMPYIQMPLGDANPNIARGILLEFLEEKTQKEPLSDVLMKLLKF